MVVSLKEMNTEPTDEDLDKTIEIQSNQVTTRIQMNGDIMNPTTWNKH